MTSYNWHPTNDILETIKWHPTPSKWHPQVTPYNWHPKNGIQQPISDILHHKSDIQQVASYQWHPAGDIYRWHPASGIYKWHPTSDILQVISIGAIKKWCYDYKSFFLNERRISQTVQGLKCTNRLTENPILSTMTCRRMSTTLCRFWILEQRAYKGQKSTNTTHLQGQPTL